ncbi:hypothetical protein ABN097_04670 [Enterobacter cloacae]|uniref:DUF4760 domain-containing protein n=1 Tax=Enterobacter cloacae complex TaxID=354276 RepID=UPI002431692A|nr:hypothetical protein [Enterobacter hormaechei]WGB55601.1 hypothetical protein NFL40_12980 [Enterobacter hormaechei]
MIFEILNTALQLLLIYTVVVAAMAYIKNLRDKKKLLTLSYIKRWNDRAFESHTADKNKPNDNILDWEHQSKLAATVHLNLSFFEELALAIFNSQADEKLAKDFFYINLMSTYRFAEKEMQNERLVFSNSLYRNAERLYGRWLKDQQKGE